MNSLIEGRTCAPCVEVDVQMRESERAWHISKTADLTEVLTAWRKVSGLDPNDGVALNNVGVLLYHLGRTAEAVVVLERAVDLRPRQGLVLANLAWVSYADGGRGVEEMFGRASRRSPWLLPFGIGRLSPEALKTRSVPSGHLGPSDSPNRNLMALSQAIGLGPIALRDPSEKRGAEAMRLRISHFVREETTPHSSSCRAPDLILPAVFLETADPNGEDRAYATLRPPPKAPSAGEAKTPPNLP